MSEKELKLIECPVCGTKFSPSKDRHYIAVGRSSRSTIIDPVDEFLFDAYDCPYCGSQYIAGSRKNKLETKEGD